jgi:hypothetical protein
LFSLFFVIPDMPGVKFCNGAVVAVRNDFNGFYIGELKRSVYYNTKKDVPLHWYTIVQNDGNSETEITESTIFELAFESGQPLVSEISPGSILSSLPQIVRYEVMASGATVEGAEPGRQRVSILRQDIIAVKNKLAESIKSAPLSVPVPNAVGASLYRTDLFLISFQGSIIS